MRIHIAALLVLAGLPFTTSAQSPGHTAEGPTVVRDKIHPQMRRLLAERGPSKAWVFFKDKGIQDNRTLRRELEAAERDLNPRQRERRRLRRTLPGLVDFRDIPVNRGYIAQVEGTGATKVVETSWLNAISVFANEQELEAIARLDFVDRIEPVRRGVLIDGATDFLETPLPSASSAQNRGPSPSAFYGLTKDQLEQINLIRLHQRGFTGNGIIIGILDTGFHRGHEAFNQPGHVVNVIAEWDFVNNDPNTDMETGDDPSQHFHGTWILGCIGSYLPGTLVGGAYDASFVLAKTEDVTNEYMQEEDFYVSGLQFIESNGADLATSSLGYIDWYTQSDLDGLTAVTTIGVNAATANGLVCCTAAGNSGHDSNPTTSTLIAPADALEVITVGAVDSTGTIASFSSEGPTADGRVKPEVLARGVSTYTVCSDQDTNCTTTVSGTSLSTPLMAAGVACMIGAHPNWPVSKFRSRIFATGDYFQQNGTFDPLYILGYGIPDLAWATFGKPAHTPANQVPTVIGG